MRVQYVHGQLCEWDGAHMTSGDLVSWQPASAATDALTVERAPICLLLWRGVALVLWPVWMAGWRWTRPGRGK